MKNEIAISKELLSEIIRKFAENGRVFVNEAQFQFELGYALQKCFDESGYGYKVSFEVVSIDTTNKGNDSKSGSSIENSTSRKHNKIYTDIVVDMGEAGLAAIELKYKTAQLGGNKALNYKVKGIDNKDIDNIVFPQGAYDNGCYDYWYDVYRIEQLVYNSGNFKPERNFTCGFAIIMTNDKNYWAEHKKRTYFKNFYLENNKQVNGEIKWFDIENNKEAESLDKKDWRYSQSIQITNSYTINWEPYKVENCEKCFFGEAKEKAVEDNNRFNFQFLILEIPPQKQ